MRIETSRTDLSFCRWYPLLSKNSLEATILPLPDRVFKYLEHDAFVLPKEATTSSSRVAQDSEWSDGTTVVAEEEEEEPPTFPEFSERIQSVIEDYGAVFVKFNWSSPADAVWVTPTKSLKCTSLEDVYLLLKSSDRISQDLSTLASRNSDERENSLQPCLVLKRWRDIDPCTEFRCYVVDRQLVGIGQRDVSQYYKHIENEKYDIPRDIKSLFMENIKDKFPSDNYSFDVIRYKKDKVKIVDFGPLDETTTKGTLFTIQELHGEMEEILEFRFIFEDMGIQPKATRHLCLPREINEFFQASAGMSAMDRIRQEVEEQAREERRQAEAGS